MQRLSQDEFGTLAFEVMREVFKIHLELGRLFDERIYKRELARRLPGTRLEVSVDVTFDTFAKRYLLDVVVGPGGLFEFKSAEAIVPWHRAQTLHYLLIAGLAHAKLVNMRPEDVTHEFVNTSLAWSDRLQFALDIRDWSGSVPGTADFKRILEALLHDWGTGLELPLYEEALTHFLGGETTVCADVPVLAEGTELGRQKLRLAAPGVAFKLTALPKRQSAFAGHAQRLLEHTDLEAILWANLTLRNVTLTTITR